MSIPYSDSRHPLHTMYLEGKLKSKPKPEVPSKPNVSDIGDKFRLIWEAEIGYTISCSTCLEYLKSLNKSTKHDHVSVMKKLMTTLPTPDHWRKNKSRNDRYERISLLLSEVIPKKLVVVFTPEKPIDKPKDNNWAVLVTAAPRKECTLSKCISSIRKAGWEPEVFAEPDTTVVPNVKYHYNSVRLGAWHNWLSSVRWALTKTQCRYILTVQDDSLFHPDSRSFVESVMWPSNSTGFVSLYTAKHYSENGNGGMRKVGVNKLNTTSLWGACALVFPRDVLQQLVNHTVALNWLGVAPSKLSDRKKKETLEHRRKNPHLIQNLDTAIGKILNGLHLDMYTIDPSPVQHISKHSAIGHGSNSGKRNCGRCASHTIPLHDQVFSQ